MKDKALMRSKMKRFIARFIVYVFAFGIAVTAFYPFFVMIISSTHDSYDIVARANVLPGTHFAENYARLTQNIDLYRGIANSLFLAVVVTAVQCYFTVLAAYGFSKFEFKGKNFLFSVVMVAMMLPGQLGIIGFYKEIQAMNLLNSYIPLVIPTIANCFAVFFYKQFMDGAIPNELLEAVVMAGGIYDRQDAGPWLKLGMDGVQMATRFVTTWECDAAQAYKDAYLKAEKEDIVLVKSPVGMPGRAIRNAFLERAQKGRIPHGPCHGCIKTCSPADTPYCITEALVNAVKGDVDNGLIFCGSNAWRAQRMEHVKDIMAEFA